MKPTLQTVQDVVIEILIDMTQDWGLEEDFINAETKIAEDLGLSSIDVLHLFSGIDIHFSKKLPFETLILTNDEEFVSDLSVQEIVSFVFDNFDIELSSTPTPM
jgi:acyl carrier protein